MRATHRSGCGREIRSAEIQSLYGGIAQHRTTRPRALERPLKLDPGVSSKTCGLRKSEEVCQFSI